MTLRPHRSDARDGRMGILLSVPLFGFLFLALVVPLGGILLFSLSASDGIFSNYAQVLTSRVFLKVIGTTVALGVVVAAVTTLFAFVFSLWVLRLGRRAKVVTIGLVILPFFISYLLRALSWIPLLGYGGLVNKLLVAAGIVQSPLSLIYNPFAVVLGTSNVLFPVAALPLLAAFHSLDRRLVDAAHSLGASRWTAFRRVFLPLVAPAVMSTAVMVFAIATGFYITPSVLGGGKVLLAPNLIELLIHRRGEWDTGAALTIVLLAVFMSSIMLSRRIADAGRRRR